MKKREFEEFLSIQLEEELSSFKVAIDQKFRIDNPDDIRKRLAQIGAKRGAMGYEHNELFDADGVLRKKKHILRLRYHGSQPACLTFKGKRKKGVFKTRIELESTVHYEHMKRILEMLGYRVFSSYRKYREEYELTFGKVCLDQLPNLGWFVEIEGSQKTIQSIARRLGLEKSDLEERSYRKILKEELVAA